MSIWASWEDIGADSFTREGANRGRVVAYPAGFSNAYPLTVDDAPATLALAHIPPWCVPGHFDDPEIEYDEGLGPWVRLDVDSPNARTWWRKGDDGEPQHEPVHASVILDEEAARSLRDDLTRWLDTPKVHPMDGAS